MRTQESHRNIYWVGRQEVTCVQSFCFEYSGRRLWGLIKLQWLVGQPRAPNINNQPKMSSRVEVDLFTAFNNDSNRRHFRTQWGTMWCQVFTNVRLIGIPCATDVHNLRIHIYNGSSCLFQILNIRSSKFPLGDFLFAEVRWVNFLEHSTWVQLFSIIFEQV